MILPYSQQNQIENVMKKSLLTIGIKTTSYLGISKKKSIYLFKNYQISPKPIKEDPSK